MKVVNKESGKRATGLLWVRRQFVVFFFLPSLERPFCCEITTWPWASHSAAAFQICIKVHLPGFYQYT